MGHIALLQPYWSERDGLQAMPGAAEAAMPTQAIAAHQVTNLAAFKAYAYAYLMGHPRIGKGPGMFLMVRTMETSPTGCRCSCSATPTPPSGWSTKAYRAKSSTI